MKVMKVVDHGRDVVDAAEGGSVVVIADVALRGQCTGCCGGTGGCRAPAGDAGPHARRPTTYPQRPPGARTAARRTRSAVACLTLLPLDAVPGGDDHPSWESSSGCASKKCAARWKASGSGVSSTPIVSAKCR